MAKTYKQTAVHPTLKVAIFLKFLATGSYQRPVGNDFLGCVSQASMCRILDECLTVFECHYCPKQIKLNISQEEEQSAKCRINEKFNFPGVLGFVDGTHVRIKCPEVNPEFYYNRKGYHSINAMIICDDKLVIRFVDARHPGSNHDSFIWKGSQADDYFNLLYSGGERNVWVLGDSGYPLLPYLMTPLRNCNTEQEEKYNKSHIKARNCVERCIGVLKNRFRCILGERGLHYEPHKVTKIINVCCALHNACIKFENIIDPPEEPIIDDVADDVVQESSLVANDIRRRIINNF
ncbi:putative nuclease HARBI1 [Lucilia sericata]|uniref:putative nuclease HARBI1 n=1 Tax=Lucilia sericata TaxID=13632 RepID=UPI0018A84D7B|nr:putative nuclease HARBI1 [Lucilia sericata]